jgi:hypothetical protein
MAIGSKVNPNFPIPGLDQSSKGFRDNFATIKSELETLQITGIQLGGALTSPLYYLGTSQIMVIDTTFNISDVRLPAPYNAIQYNKDGFLEGNVNLIFNDSTISVGIGTSLPDSHYGLDVKKPIRGVGELYISQQLPEKVGNIIIETTNGVVRTSNFNTYAEIGTDGNISLDIVTDSTSRVFVSTTGNVGINTREPTATFNVLSKRTSIGEFYSTVSNQNSGIMVSTGGVGASASVGLETKIGNWSGGMRIDQAGILTFHTGEHCCENFNDDSFRVAITTIGDVGIGTIQPQSRLDVNGSFRSSGITDTSDIDCGFCAVGVNNREPVYALDVRGDIATGNAWVCTGDGLVIDADWLTVDAWPKSSFRTAKYIVQAVGVVLGAECVNIFEFIVTHANNVVYVSTPVQQQFPTASYDLGDVQAINDPVNSNFILVQFRGGYSGIHVRTTKTYIV